MGQSSPEGFSLLTKTFPASSLDTVRLRAKMTGNTESFRKSIKDGPASDEILEARLRGVTFKGQGYALLEETCLASRRQRATVGGRLTDHHGEGLFTGLHRATRTGRPSWFVNKKLQWRRNMHTHTNN
jgi:hypothetical protein